LGLYRRNSGMWWMTYTVHGVQRWESCLTHKKREATNTLKIRLGEIAQGRFHAIPTTSPLLTAWSDEFLETIQDPNTKRRYQSSITHLRSFFPKARIGEISPRDVESFKQSRLNSGVGPATVNRDLAVFRRMLKIAARQRLIAESPFSGVDFLEERKHRKQPHILTFDEQNKLLAAAPPRIRVLIVLLTETGLRVGKEALRLRWQHVDFENDLIHVKESKTPSGIRSVVMSTFCKAELLAWKNLLGPDFSPWVFPSLSNTRNSLQGGRKSWASALKKAGVSYFPIYQLRHAFASRLSAAGASPVTIAHMLGHSSSSGIVMTYAKALDEARRDAIRRLEEFRQSHKQESTEIPNPGVLQ
jgi:integrase